jgi:tetratricopeptide (TPR) repeat protein
VFRGGWSNEAAEEVCRADPGDVLVLIEASLIRGDDDRFSMLETVREFAQDRLAESGEVDGLRRRHAEYMLTLAERARPFARGPEEKQWVDQLIMELDNFRAAFQYALEAEDAALGITTAEALEPLWIRGMRQREAVRWLEPLLALDGEVNDAVRAGALTLAGRSAIEAGETNRAEPWFRTGLELARESGDELRTAWALHGLGHLLAEQGNSKGAQALFEESMDIFLRLGEHAPAGGRMTFLGYYAAREGDFDRAQALYEQATEEYRLAGDLAGVGSCIHSLGDIALQRGDVMTALGRFREAQPLLFQAGSAIDIEIALAGIAAAAALLGRPGPAARIWGAVERMDSEAERKLEADDRARYEQALGHLDPVEVQAGQALSNDAAVELARVTAAELATA